MTWQDMGHCQTSLPLAGGKPDPLYHHQCPSPARRPLQATHRQLQAAVTRIRQRAAAAAASVAAPAAAAARIASAALRFSPDDDAVYVATNGGSGGAAAAAGGGVGTGAAATGGQALTPDEAAAAYAEAQGATVTGRRLLQDGRDSRTAVSSTSGYPWYAGGGMVEGAAHARHVADGLRELGI
jgi:hypothetical protein